MTKIKCMLVIFILSTGSLFSQDERNEILEEDTITPVNTAIVTEVDAVVIEESVSEPEEKTDLSNSFYNDYLDYIKKTNSTGDVPLANKCKNNAIISGRIGVFLIGSVYSMALDIPISSNISITTKYITGRGGIDGDFRISSFGVGAVVTKTKYFILKLNACPGLTSYDGNRGFGLTLGSDILFKIFKPCYISINPDLILCKTGSLGIISLGLNIVY